MICNQARPQCWRCRPVARGRLHRCELRALRGEILGIAGMLGAAAPNCCAPSSAQTPATAANLDPRPARRITNPSKNEGAGLAFTPENRKEEAPDPSAQHPRQYVLGEHGPDRPPGIYHPRGRASRSKRTSNPTRNQSRRHRSSGLGAERRQSAKSCIGQLAGAIAPESSSSTSRRAAWMCRPSSRFSKPCGFEPPGHCLAFCIDRVGRVGRSLPSDLNHARGRIEGQVRPGEISADELALRCMGATRNA